MLWGRPGGGGAVLFRRVGLAILFSFTDVQEGKKSQEDGICWWEMELVFYARFIRGRNDDPSKLEMDEAELEDYFDGEDGERNEFTSPLSRVFYTSRTLAETLINEHRCAIIIHTFCHFIFSLSVSAFFAPSRRFNLSWAEQQFFSHWADIEFVDSCMVFFRKFVSVIIFLRFSLITGENSKEPLKFASTSHRHDSKTRNINWKSEKRRFVYIEESNSGRIDNSRSPYPPSHYDNRLRSFPFPIST